MPAEVRKRRRAGLRQGRSSVSHGNGRWPWPMRPTIPWSHGDSHQGSRSLGQHSDFVLDEPDDLADAGGRPTPRLPSADRERSIGSHSSKTVLYIVSDG